MRIAVYCPAKKRGSTGINVYRDNIVAGLRRSGVETITFNETESLPGDVDMYWDPRSASASKPYPPLHGTRKPYAITLHGVLSFSIAAHERVNGLIPALEDRVRNTVKYYNWRDARRDHAAVITVSHYIKNQAVEHLKLAETQVTPIWHGVDHSTFQPCDDVVKEAPYLLHISNGLPTKNVPRMLEAYQRLPQSTRPPFKLLLPGYRYAAPAPDIKIIREKISLETLVRLYQGALAYIFPSLHEGFGLPIIEAMTCGCPVITSNVTACPEIAGDAAMLVNPRSVNEITEALQTIIDDEPLRVDLREKGLRRASQFTWEKSSIAHLRLFEEIINHAG